MLEDHTILFSTDGEYQLKVEDGKLKFIDADIYEHTGDENLFGF